MNPKMGITCIKKGIKDALDVKGGFYLVVDQIVTVAKVNYG